MVALVATNGLPDKKGIDKELDNVAWRMMGLGQWGFTIRGGRAWSEY